MASILEIILQEKSLPEHVVNWLKKSSNSDTSDILQELENAKQEFIPYFLNYLRDHTIHLLQTSKSATPSPTKTPLKNLRKTFKNKEYGATRQQLFCASPDSDVADMHNLNVSAFSPNTSLESPCNVSLNLKTDKNASRSSIRSSYSNQKYSPQCGSQRSLFINDKCYPHYGSQKSPHAQQNGEQRSKQKLSLGEFMTSDCSNNNANNWKRRSPHSAGKKDVSIEQSSTFLLQGKKSDRKKKQCQNIVSVHAHEKSLAPVFSLNSSSDFPPMESLSLQSNMKTLSVSCESDNKLLKSCDTNISRMINFENDDPFEVSQIKQIRTTVNSISSTTNATLKNNSGPRRITPTSVKADTSVHQNSAFLVPIKENENHMESKQCNWTRKSDGEKDKSVNNSWQEEREMLKKERAKFNSHTPKAEPVTSLQTPTKPGFDHSTSVVDIVEANIGEITHQDKLDLLITLYSCCMTANLLPNIVVEMYFLVQLLTARGGEADDTSLYGEDVVEENYFCSVHNTVYFAVSVLAQQKRLLKVLDRSTLRLLSENLRVAIFSADLHTYLLELYEKAETKDLQSYSKSPIGSVSFQADTDNRYNFPNDRCFHLFKKQRDGFYELIREWEDSHMNPNYNMADLFGSKVQALVNLTTNVVNFLHFARLFQSQLIAMCKPEGGGLSTNDDEDIALLSHLKRNFPEKFKKLQERFIKPHSVGGPCPAPSFPGIQEFFRDFILVAGNPLLNQHLCDIFTAKVLELNDTTFESNDEVYTEGSNADVEEKEMFCSVLLSLRLVGKFLGFLTFLPYRTADKIPDGMEVTYIRNKHQPSINLLDCLQIAYVSGKLTLTIPWMIEFLSMMDSMAPRLDHLQTVLFALLYIHRYVWLQLQDEVTFGNLMLVILIGWLLENPVLPDGFFFSEIPDAVRSMFGNDQTTLAALDNRLFIDQSVFYTCCPYIGELKTLLIDFAVGCSSKVSTVRKITPISADVPLPLQKSLTDRQLQLQMEENFFHNHPASLKRVVDFVADRTASNYIKLFRGSLLQDSVADGKEKLIKQIHVLPEGSPSNKMKDRVFQMCSKVSQELYSSVRASVIEKAPNYCHDRIPLLMQLLLPDDQSTVVFTMASCISERVAVEKIMNWLNKHVTTAMYQTELMPEVEKISRNLITEAHAGAVSHDNDMIMPSESKSGSPQWKDADQVSCLVMPQSHDDTCRHPSDVFIDLKDCVKNLALRGRPIAEDKMLEILKQTRLVFECRQDILPSVHKSFSQLTVELLISTLIFQSESYTPALVDTCCQLWTTSLRDTNSLGLIFSGRVVQMIQNADNLQVKWDKYSKLLITMYKAGLVQPKQILETAHKLMPYINNDTTLRSVRQCLCNFAEYIAEEKKRESVDAIPEDLYNMLPGELSC